MNGDTARVSVALAVAPETAFEIFTRDIGKWWRRGVKFRHAGERSGFIHMEPRAGGRLFESFDADEGPQVVAVGTVQVWDHPARHGLDHLQFIRMIGLWWGDQMTALREFV